MVSGEDWVDVGSTDVLARTPLKSCKARAIPIAISFKDGQFGAVSNICNHVGGPLGEGRLDGDYIHLSLARLEVPSPHRRGRAWIRRGSRASVPRQGRERPRTRQRRGAVAAYQSAAPTASALAQSRACAGAAASRWHLDDRHGHDQPALLLAPTICSTVRSSRRLTSASRRGSSGSTISRSAPARVTIRRRRRPAPGPARSRKWMRATS